MDKIRICGIMMEHGNDDFFILGWILSDRRRGKRNMGNSFKT